jgi:hypothetical protein
MGVVIDIIIGLQGGAARAPARPDHGACACLTKLAIFGRIPILLSDDTAPSYDGDPARDKINPPAGRAPRLPRHVSKSVQNPAGGRLPPAPWSIVLIHAP